MTTQVAQKDVRFSDDVLAGIDSFDAALAALASEGVQPETMDDYGTGFKVCNDKDRLIKVPFVILSWKFNQGDFGLFVSAEIVTKHGEKFILNDGSTGIKDQLVMVEEQRRKRGHPTPNAGLLVEGGLTRSDYKTMIPDGKTGELVESAATTYYLAE